MTEINFINNMTINADGLLSCEASPSLCLQLIGFAKSYKHAPLFHSENYNYQISEDGNSIIAWRKNA